MSPRGFSERCDRDCNPHQRMRIRVCGSSEEIRGSNDPFDQDGPRKRKIYSTAAAAAAAAALFLDDLSYLIVSS